MYSNAVIPVLVLAYSRLDSLSQVLESIDPSFLGPIFVSCDGPKEADKVANSKVVNFLKDQLRLHKISYLNIRTKNEGISRGIEDGIDWFFSNVDFGIVIEDDVVLKNNSETFINIGVSLLQLDETVKLINLRNTVPEYTLTNVNSFFRKSKLLSSHGWLSSSKNWHEFRLYENKISLKEVRNAVPAYLGHFEKKAFMEVVRQNQINRFSSDYNWDVSWQAYLFATDSYTLNSNRNLVDYIGHRADSTHHVMKPRRKDRVYQIEDLSRFSLDSPTILEIDAERFRFKMEMRHTFPRYLVRKSRLNRLVSNFLNW
jgi:hypothetical protein